MNTEQVVGAVIVRDGRAFVIKRSLTRRLFPGCWDVPGGHVDVGEEPLHALAREIEEETGWILRTVVAEIGQHRWEGDDGNTRIEVDYLVTVDGDLDRPRLEEDKHPEHRWITPSELELLSEGRKPADEIIKRVIGQALSLAVGFQLADEASMIRKSRARPSHC